VESLDQFQGMRWRLITGSIQNRAAQNNRRKRDHSAKHQEGACGGASRNIDGLKPNVFSLVHILSF
jgi:hypothetical protein